MDMSDDGECVHTSSLFEQAPESWWLQLINILPAKDKLKLFQVSRQLASRLMQCSARVALHLQSKNFQQLTAGEAGARRSVITELLQGCCGLKIHVRLRHQTGVPFPTSLSKHVTHIDIWLGKQANPASACLDWQALQNMKELTYSTLQSSDQDVSGLCAALEAGQLPYLNSMTIQLNSGDPPNTLLERLACALGPQLKRLATNRGPLMRYLPHFTALQAVHLSHCLLSPDQAQALCEHPNLGNLHLGPSFKMQGDHSQRCCTWGILEVVGYELDVLQVLPLSGVQQVRIMSGVHGKPSLQRQVIRAVVAQHGHKISCQPVHIATYTGLPTFTLSWPCEEMLPLLPQLQSACRLLLDRDPLHAGVLHAMFRALPACVEVVTLEFMKKVDWLHLWQGLPEHVYKFEVLFCEVDVSDLCELVRTAPKHILAMELMPQRKEQYAEWEAAGLRECASGQVQLHIRR